MRCQNCGFEQPPGTECSKCGIVFRKFIPLEHASPGRSGVMPSYFGSKASIWVLVALALGSRIAQMYYHNVARKALRERSEILGFWAGYCAEGSITASVTAAHDPGEVLVLGTLCRGRTALDPPGCPRDEGLGAMTLRKTSDGFWRSEGGSASLEVRGTGVVFRTSKTEKCELSR
jgi:hypothetical protein